MKKEAYEKPEIKSEESEISLHGAIDLSAPRQFYEGECSIPTPTGEQGCGAN